MTVGRRGDEELAPDPDVVVVGANVAGSSIAYELASRGLSVTLVERRRQEDVGRSSCGDGIERYQFESLGLEVPQGDFILREVDRAFVVSPDGKHRLTGEAAGIAIERFGLNQFLLERATAAGAGLVDATMAVNPILYEERVEGVRCKPVSGGDHYDIRAAVTVDAGGWRGVLRRALPRQWPVTEEIPRREMAIAYREERRREEPCDELMVEAHFDFEVTPKGLYWRADRTRELVNVGVGMQWLPDMPNPRRVVRERVLPMFPDLEGTRLLRAGGGVIPNRRPLDCPVGPGFVAIGDAACQMQPMSGSGIGASMYAARLAAETLKVALETTRRPGMSALFPYVVEYHRTYGAHQAANHVLRASLQALTNAQLNKLMGSRLVSEDELVTAARKGRLDLGFMGKLRAAGSLIGEPRLIGALKRMQGNMERARSLYLEFPEDPGTLPEWRRRVAAHFSRL
jgi:geranylgeranyl reductase family protein